MGIPAMRAMVWFSNRAVSSAGAQRIGTGRLGDRSGDSYLDPVPSAPARRHRRYRDAQRMTGKPISDDSPAAGARLACPLGLAGVRVAVVNLDGGADGLAATLRAALEADEDLGRSARLGGPSLALAAYAAAGGAAGGALPEPAWVLSAGGAVGRGLPTAARGTLTARTRLRPGVVEAQFGGLLAASFATRLDALLVYGRSERPVVLECFPSVDIEGETEGSTAGPFIKVVPAPAGLQGEGLSARAQLLRATFGNDVAILAVGPAADLGLGIANVASISPGIEGAPSFVGRGGMGLSLREAGVMAVVVHDLAEAIGRGESAESQRLRERLLESPRLLARDVGGTLELGALRGEASPNEQAARPTQVPSTATATKHGCRGCPTPCGWTFDQPRAAESAGSSPSGFARTGGRFAALQGAIGEKDGGMPFLADCNDLGLDARSAALVMGAVRQAGEVFHGPRDFMDQDSAAFRAAVLLRSDSDVEPAPSHHSADLAAEVGVRCSARGPEPVRSLSVLSFGSVEPRSVVAPLPWSGDADWDAGVLAYWHECFAAAIDISGFCAFSAAGLLADGVLGVGELAAMIAPPRGWGADTGAGLAMLRSGAQHVERHRCLSEASPSEGGAASDSARLTRALEGYVAARAHGFGAQASPLDAALSAAKSAPSTAPAAEGLRNGSVRLRLSGLLAARLGPVGEPNGLGSTELDWRLPYPGADLGALLGSLAAAHPALAPWLLAPDGRVIPAAISGGRHLEPAAPIVRGAEIELILAIPGG